MRQFFPVEELARDARFQTVTNHERMVDPRTVFQPHRQVRNNNRLTPSRRDASDAARALMHGIFVGEIQALGDWLRKVTENDPERRKRALEFQSLVDKLFSYGGTRSDSEESPIGLARRFRELAGFTDTEVDEIADVSLAALNERKAFVAKASVRA